MSEQPDENLGHLDDDAEAAEPSSDTEGGAAAAGEYDPAEGSPGTPHPTGEAFPDEAVRYDEPEGHPRAE
ncbi:hypothetical protein GCM10023340_40100 [Nocardioides marinquilinus]|uniref:Uncharacterized protein n=1 Tax=Nocardioides marinquilinus TaxID=1210400 RepID=A0ABP9Q368_9ACTN